MTACAVQAILFCMCGHSDGYREVSNCYWLVLTNCRPYWTLCHKTKLFLGQFCYSVVAFSFRRGRGSTRVTA